jgi:two-component system, NarL family, nitrate/nitrite response regulator NarL
LERTSQSPTILVLGSDRLFADAVRITLERTGYGVSELRDTSDDVIAVVDGVGPDVVLIEVSPSGEGLGLGSRLARDFPDTKVVALTDDEDAILAERSISFGCSGYLTKAIPTAQFVRSVAAIVDGQVVVAASSPPDGMVGATAGDDSIHRLTSREREVLTLIARGTSSNSIAEELSVSDHTVRTHLQNIFSKLGVRSRVQAAAMAVRHGLR